MRQGYRIFLFVIGVLGVVLQILDDGIGMLMYYTIQSNLLVVLFLLYAIRKPDLGERALRVKGGVVTAILITFLVYHFMLAPIAADKDYYNIENFICHYILPLGILLDTLVFDAFTYRPYHPPLWSLVPAVYFGFAVLNGVWFRIPIPGRTSAYPYFFVDIDKYGILPVMGYCVVILAAYIALGYLLMGGLYLLRRRTAR